MFVLPKTEKERQTMRNQTFGIEIEMTGLTRYRAATTIAAYFEQRNTTERNIQHIQKKDQTGESVEADERRQHKSRKRSGIATTDHRVGW